MRKRTLPYEAPALLSGAAAADNLSAMPAKDIERIEIMTDPPPQYRAEGVAGVSTLSPRVAAPADMPDRC